MNLGQFIFLAVFVVLIGFFAGFFFLLKNRNKYKKLYVDIYDRYKDVIDLDEYKEKVTKETKEILDSKNDEIMELDIDISNLKNTYAEKHKYFEKLLHEIHLYEEIEDIFSYGLYEPHFDFATSSKYKEEIQKVREKQKACIKDEDAAYCLIQWTVDGSKAKGKKQTKQYIKLMLRAFNGECDAMLSDIRWNNITKMEERLQKSFETINKMGEVHLTSITEEYKELKLDELRLSFEYQKKLHEEKEEQRLIKEQMKEEEKVQKEIEKKQKEIEKQLKEQAIMQEKLREAYEQGKKSEAEKFENRIKELNQQIEDNKRTVSQAQLTKTGHVYVISNIGSFGENIYKIGMTRRLEPMERIEELSSASVPFEFDVHALIKSENAPELENSLHKYFDSRRVNLVNSRKEFFYVKLDEIEKYTKEKGLDIEFTKLAEAKDFRESQAIRESQAKKKTEKQVVSEIVPASI